MVLDRTSRRIYLSSKVCSVYHRSDWNICFCNNDDEDKEYCFPEEKNKRNITQHKLAWIGEK